jgi:hypothetical protein
MNTSKIQIFVVLHCLLHRSQCKMEGKESNSTNMYYILAFLDTKAGNSNVYKQKKIIIFSLHH